MGTSTRFARFVGNISLKPSDHDDAKRKYDGVAGTLHRNYYSTHYDGSSKLLIGSYEKDTGVRPPRDVDILFLMPYAEYGRYDSYLGNGQSQLLQDIKKIIQVTYPTTDKIRGDGQVVVVPFKNGHTVELLPAWQSRSGKYIIPNTHDGGSWRIVDHPAEIENVSKSDEATNGNTRALIKMIKIWQAECNVPIKSLAIELRAVNFLSGWSQAKQDTLYYDWMVRDYLGELIKKTNATCTIPGITEKCNYGDAWLSKAQTAYQRAVKACDYEAQGKEVDATIEWRKIFGSLYEY